MQYLVMLDNCLLSPFFFYVLAMLIILTLVKLVYALTQKKTVVVAKGGFLVKLKPIGTAGRMVLSWADMVMDVLMNIEMQNYISSQRQTNCSVLNAKGMFDPSGFVLNGKPYPPNSEYANFQEYVTKILQLFPEAGTLQTKVHEFNAVCIEGNRGEGFTPDCEYVPGSPLRCSLEQYAPTLVPRIVPLLVTLSSHHYVPLIVPLIVPLSSHP